MAVHDVDRNGPDRGNPNPNTHDLNFVSSGGPIINTPRPAHGTNSVNPVTDATSTDQASLLSGIGQLVKTGSVTMTLNGSATTTVSFSHGLGYTPYMIAAINNATSTIATGTATGVSLFLPTFLIANIGTDVAGVVTFQTYLYGFANSTTVYFNCLDAGANSGHVTITYYLYRQAAD